MVESALSFAEVFADRFWSFLCWASWNPLWAGLFGGLFALMGAVIGGKFVLQSVKTQREVDRRAAGRALSAELEMNLAAVASLTISGRAKPLDYLTYQPPLMRAVLDDRLTLFSELLSPSEFQALVSLYARASASYSLLDDIRQRSQPFTPGQWTSSAN